MSLNQMMSRTQIQKELKKNFLASQENIIIRDQQFFISYESLYPRPEVRGFTDSSDKKI